METLGHDWSAPALAAELMKDAAYFRSSGGGVTLSGGEATMQPEFALELLKGLAHRGVHTALDTCGVAAWPVMERLLPHVDLLLFDVKEMDPSRHRRFTGAGNHRVLETLRRVTGAMERGGGPRELWVRTPIIPGVTDRTENIRRIGAFLRQYVGAKLSRWDLCAFNNLCLDKYLRLGRDWAFAGSPLVGRRQMEALAEIARLSGLEESVVHWSGSVTEDGR
jgi:pyruvate formate lyase activating enzyme